MTVLFVPQGMGFASLTKSGGSVTTMPCISISYSPNMGVEPFRSGGDINASMMRRAGSRPAFRFTAPLASIYGAFASMLPVTLTTFKMFAAPFTGIQRGVTAAPGWSLNADGFAYGCITRIYSVGGQLPLVLAEVTVLLCSTKGLLDPVSGITENIPALSTTPPLHALGPMLDDTTKVWGVKGWSIDVGLGMEPIQTDGMFYPTDYRLNEINATASFPHADVSSWYTNLGGDGKDATGAGIILYARAYDMTTKTLTTTGYSFTLATSFVELDTLELSGTDLANAVIRVSAYAAPGSLVHPISVATGATLPVPA